MSLILQFRAAEREYDHAFCPDYTKRDSNRCRAANDAKRAAARRLLADAAARHRVEERAVVWLELDEQGDWAVSSTTFDGDPLVGYDHGPLTTECECADRVECEAVRDAAAFLPLPTARELLTLMMVGESL